MMTDHIDRVREQASRLTQDDIADALACAHDEWCVLPKEFLAGRGDDPGSEYEYKANAIRVLLTDSLRSVDQ